MYRSSHKKNHPKCGFVEGAAVAQRVERVVQLVVRSPLERSLSAVASLGKTMFGGG